MNIAIIILGILYLMGLNVGKALAICAIIEGLLLFIESILEMIKKEVDK